MCDWCRVGSGLNTLYTVFDGMEPELSDGSFLSKC